MHLHLLIVKFIRLIIIIIQRNQPIYYHWREVSLIYPHKTLLRLDYFIIIES